MRASLPAADQRLIQIVDAALADAARKSGEWLVCRKGCTQCCYGAFAISQLDALRLQKGLYDLKSSDPRRAAQVKRRAQQAVKRLAATFRAIPRPAFWMKAKMLKQHLRNSPTTSPAPRLIPPQALVICMIRAR